MSKPRQKLSVDIPLSLIKELLSESEIKMMQRRVMIGKLRQHGMSVRSIALELGVGTDTVMRTIKQIAKNSALKKFFTEPIQKTSLKWVFGEIGSKEERN
ncbi:hypothetical protein A2631_04140 [Candidatus Daviesbacteria bacterium RIFCSPHIGHO2_01_FULL_44_29]|uniref:Uncharacterized protein n=1 Tax=Candidatus Daviesbacteria bacterium RIFCSPHIGHO2_02_FULL_43_12 TaxID=1797776 RepID=A0A1F5KGD5_9BACT|nr:MAG: hypothetical protein A2631_04140 [Candidatus Daviesbacteria bacterium RIFCSPHIGHO2_01_FULL_44_29]OGE39919.1 MAG: hypothetical protein A3D25_03870 [Candidatus Daviesbacteria bacterium RIFCSPHIGHO2_02_FULL_43_12]OGE40523.1 MAG: hypothetical protein A3E86_00915 [Candidatus Daviesbacteria bacterium RIFCSPHIGHO2_12_FULL_47_45]OGE70400.1 MAG: hypothetical protein A3B55_01700 [Candidatus Daviesbacteria bacterium RIFCSPLOWO2_01_FULL_43_15]